MSSQRKIDVTADLARESIRSRLFADEKPVQLGRFSLGKRLGEGGMGVVYAGYDPQLDRPVAIKLLRSSRPSRAERLGREAKAMARLTHPNVVSVYESGSEGEQVFLVMELVKGVDLRRWLAAQPRPWRTTLALLMGAARGLIAAHAAGLVHRDFKPENVLVTDDGTAKVADFGLARIGALSSDSDSEIDTALAQASSLHRITRTGAVVGTPAYLPPEVVDGSPADARSDQFSFCVTAYEALVGRRPFDGSTLAEVMDKVRQGDVSLEGERRLRGVLKILRRGLSADPVSRYASMQDLSDRLRPFAEARTPRRTVALAVGVSALLGGAVWAANLNDGAAEASVAPQEPWRPTMRALTRTPGAGLQGAAINPAGTQLAYRVGGQLWIRALDGGSPRLLPSPGSGAIAMEFVGSGADLAIAQDDALWRVHVDDGVTTRIAALQGFPYAMALSPDGGHVVGASKEQLWWGPLTEGPRSRRPWQVTEHPTGIAWSPDAKFFAVRAWPRGSGADSLTIFNVAGEVVAQRTVATRYTGMAWFEDQGIAVPMGGDGSLALLCLEFDPDGNELREVGTTEFAEVPFSTLDALDTTATGDWLFLGSRREQDVVVGPVRGDEVGPLKRLAQGVDPVSIDPSWIDDSELLYTSRQHLRPTAMVFNVASRTARPGAALGDGLQLVDSAGGGRRLAAESVGKREHLVLHVGDESHRLKELEAGSRVMSIRCDGEDRCVLLRRLDATAQFVIVDLKTRTVTTGGSCPADLQCMEERFSIGKDGHALVPTADGKGLEWIDPVTGTRAPAVHVPPAGYHVQSAAEWPGTPDVVVTAMADGDDSSERGYALLRLGPDGSNSVVWRSDKTWVVGPRFSPDGKSIALSAQEFHTEATLLETAKAGCAELAE